MLVPLTDVYLCLFRGIQSNIPSWLEMSVMTTHCMRQNAREDDVRVLCTVVAGMLTTATLLTQAIYLSPGCLMTGMQYLSPKLVCSAPDPVQNHVTCYNRQQ